MKTSEKLGVTPQQFQELLGKFVVYYTEPQGHKGIILHEFEAFVVGYMLKTLEKEKAEAKT